jgi:hypothetical protein
VRSTYVGVDPDTKSTAIALLKYCEHSLSILPCSGLVVSANDRDGMISALGFYSAVAPTHPNSCLVVESQHISYSQTKDPNSIVPLAQVAGACAGLLGRQYSEIRMPEPSEWKGSVPKAIHQARVATCLGWGYETRGNPPKNGYVVPHPGCVAGLSMDCFPPRTLSRFNPGAWKHLMDAFGLALWALLKDAERTPGLRDRLESRSRSVGFDPRAVQTPNFLSGRGNVLRR